MNTKNTSDKISGVIVDFFDPVNAANEDVLPAGKNDPLRFFGVEFSRSNTNFGSVWENILSDNFGGLLKVRSRSTRIGEAGRAPPACVSGFGGFGGGSGRTFGVEGCSLCGLSGRVSKMGRRSTFPSSRGSKTGDSGGERLGEDAGVGDPDLGMGRNAGGLSNRAGTRERRIRMNGLYLNGSKGFQEVL